MTGEKAIALFYLLFEGVMLFQVIFFGMIFFISKRKDTLYYALLNLFTALYLGLNATDTILSIDASLVFDSPYYLYVNFALFLLMFLMYSFFLKEIFSDTLAEHPYLKQVFRITILSIPLAYLLFVLFLQAGWNANIIFYGAHCINVPFVSLLMLYNFREKGYKGLIVYGMLVIAVCLLLTIVFTVRYNAGEHATLFDQYPLVFMRFGMLIDILIFQLVLVRRWIEKEKQLSLEKLQSQLVVEQLRNRISAELHDDIGSTLSGVTMYSHLTARLLETGEHQKASASLTVIRQSVENVVENLRALVWAVQPNQHSLEILLEKLSDFGNNICSASAIRFVYPDPIPAFPFRLTEEQNYDLYLCLKEAINNAAKYSQATVIELGIEQTAASVDFFVRDDGTGFDPSAAKEGNGLGNMRKRAYNIGATFALLSIPEKGTAIKVQIGFLKQQNG